MWRAVTGGEKTAHRLRGDLGKALAGPHGCRSRWTAACPRSARPPPGRRGSTAPVSPSPFSTPATTSTTPTSRTRSSPPPTSSARARWTTTSDTAPTCPRPSRAAERPPTGCARAWRPARSWPRARSAARTAVPGRRSSPGMQWAATEVHAKVISMSLGGADTPGIDPLEAAVNDLSAQTGALFVIAAGNNGCGYGSHPVGSPSTADAALSVAAVDQQRLHRRLLQLRPAHARLRAEAGDQRAGREHHRGRPRRRLRHPQRHLDGHPARRRRGGDPGPAAPGLDRSAAQGGPDEHRGSTPLGEHAVSPGTGPAGWTSRGRSPLRSRRVSAPLNVNQPWPRPTAPVTRTVSYRNDGTAPVVLDLAVSSVPAALVTLSTSRLEVPAGGSASVTLTVGSQGEAESVPPRRPHRHRRRDPGGADRADATTRRRATTSR